MNREKGQQWGWKGLHTDIKALHLDRKYKRGKKRWHETAKDEKLEYEKSVEWRRYNEIRK